MYHQGLTGLLKVLKTIFILGLLQQFEIEVLVDKPEETFPFEEGNKLSILNFVLCFLSCI